MRLLTLLVPLALLISFGVVPFAVTAKSAPKPKANERPTQVRDGLAEARLIEIYRLIGGGNTREALKKAEQLVADYPHFQLAQLVLGDLLSTRSRPICLKACARPSATWRRIVRT